MPPSSQSIRKSILARWHENLSRHANLFSSNSISGSTPPSVFVGSYGYPNVFVGPMVPPMHGNTAILDSPERWNGKTLEEIIHFRMNLVRGTRKVSVRETELRYVEELQEIAMSSKPIDSDLEFLKAVTPTVSLDGQSAPFGPAGQIKHAKFTTSSSTKQLEKAFYDRDLKSQDAVVALYNSGINVSKIQRCFSMGMLGQKRVLVPTKWSITAVDDIISKSLVMDILDYAEIDSYRIFSYGHLGNLFSVVLFPHRWIYEMIEAWDSGGILGFGSDFEDARGIDHPPSIAGAYFAAKLGVAEYLHSRKVQAGVIILREIRPEYAVPVGVWQVREGIRHAMNTTPQMADSLDEALNTATRTMSISKTEWLSHGSMMHVLTQKTISDYL